VKVEFVKSCRFRKTAQPAAQCTQLSGQGYSRAHAGRPMAENAIVIVGPPGGSIDALDPARDAHLIHARDQRFDDARRRRR